jgi:hypothetical protein
MELALKDIRRHLGKFLATIAGVALLLAIVLVMNGIYQGNIEDGVWLIDNTAADLWVVERGRGGPFNEASRIPLDSYKSVAATPGVARASPLAFYTAQREINGIDQQFTLIGYDIFGGAGGPGRLVQGRTIAAPHYEMVADSKLGLKLGDRVALGIDNYQVVGITSGAVDSGGNPLIYLSLADAQKVQFQQDNRAINAAAAANLQRLARAGYSAEQSVRLLPLLASGTDNINAVLVTLAPGRPHAECERSNGLCLHALRSGASRGGWRWWASDAHDVRQGWLTFSFVCCAQEKGHAMTHRAQIAIDQPVQDAFLVWLERQSGMAVLDRTSHIEDVRTAAAEAQASRVMNELWTRVFCDSAVA